METIAVLAPDGQLMGGGLNETLHGEVQAQIASGRNLVVVDLQKVPWINSSGIGTLIGCRTECRDAGGDLTLARVNSRIRELINSLNLSELLICSDSLEEAAGTFGATTD